MKQIKLIISINYIMFCVFMLMSVILSAQKTLDIPSTDGIQLKADYYEVKDSKKPIILLLHQAGSSRGEYLEIAPKLNELGFSCIAIDQRSGKRKNNIENESFKQAKEKNLKTKYVNALPDIESTMNYLVENGLDSNGIILFGSSYSASLIFIIGSKKNKSLKGLIAFSPGEYFKYDDENIMEFAKKINVPVFVASAKNEKKSWDPIYENIECEKEYFIPESKGVHGARALWKESDASETYWTSLESFLSKY